MSLNKKNAVALAQGNDYGVITIQWFNEPELAWKYINQDKIRPLGDYFLGKWEHLLSQLNHKHFYTIRTRNIPGDDKSGANFDPIRILHDYKSFSGKCKDFHNTFYWQFQNKLEGEFEELDLLNRIVFGFWYEKFNGNIDDLTRLLINAKDFQTLKEETIRFQLELIEL